jgi:hypothetical protein
MRKIGRGAAEQIMKLAAERGIEIQGPLPPCRTAEIRPPHPWLRELPRAPLGVRRQQEREMRRKSKVVPG